MTIKRPIRIGIVGFGKIARDQHVSAIRNNPSFELTALISRSPPGGDVPAFTSLEEAFAAGLNLDAVAICTPPDVRLAQCRVASEHGCAILLEKPPAVTAGDALALKRMADEAGVPIFASWHSRFAPMIAQAMAWSEKHSLRRGQINWHEDARKWHPGQEWLWRQGGFGVFDPGINALSILTALYPLPWSVSGSHFDVPENVEMPLSACFTLHAGEARMEAALDFRVTAEEVWSIHLEADGGETLDLSEGGAALCINNGPISRAESREYAGLYQQFAELIRTGESDFDTSPLEIAEAAFASAKITKVSPIEI